MFFLQFNKKPSYFDDCLNRTLVQANTHNRRRFREAIVEAKAKDVANFELALIEAFELFEHVSNIDFQVSKVKCYVLTGDCLVF